MDGSGDPLPGAQTPPDEEPSRGARAAAAVARRTYRSGDEDCDHWATECWESTLLNALTESDRAIVSPIAGTTRDAVDEVVERDGHSFRFIDTAGIRR